MLAKKITYTDFDGNKRTETFYFNINEAEAIELELEESGGLISMLMKMIETQDTPQLFRLFKKLICISIGEKSNDGKYLEKGEAVYKKFLSTNAYNELFMEITKTPEAAANFVKAIVPAQAAKAAEKYEIGENGNVVDKTTGHVVDIKDIQ